MNGNFTVHKKLILKSNTRLRAVGQVLQAADFSVSFERPANILPFPGLALRRPA